MASKDRSDYFAQRREALKMVSVMIERDALDELDGVLRMEGETRSAWIRRMIYEKIGYQKKSGFSSARGLYAKCPKCGQEAHGKDRMEILFGWRTVNGSVMPQSWCRKCRGK